MDQQLIHSSFPEKNLQTFSSGQSKSIRPVVLYLSAVKMAEFLRDLDSCSCRSKLTFTAHQGPEHRKNREMFDEARVFTEHQTSMLQVRQC